MYWRDIYPTHAAASNAERLGDLGKVKLTSEQKAAIRAAATDAKVKAAQLKATAKLQKIVRKETLRDARQTTRLSRQTAAQAKSSAKTAAFQSQGAQSASDAQTFAQNAALLAPSDSGSNLPASFSSGGGGGGGLVPADSSAVSAPENGAGGTLFGLPLPAVLIGGALLAFLLFKK